MFLVHFSAINTSCASLQVIKEAKKSNPNTLPTRSHLLTLGAPHTNGYDKKLKHFPNNLYRNLYFKTVKFVSYMRK